MSTPPADRPDPAALRQILAELRRAMDDTDVRERHAILVTDPQTGRRHVIGPYPDRFTALLDVRLTRARIVQEDPELADLTYEVVPIFAPGGTR